MITEGREWKVEVERSQIHRQKVVIFLKNESQVEDHDNNSHLVPRCQNNKKKIKSVLFR